MREIPECQNTREESGKSVRHKDWRTISGDAQHNLRLSVKKQIYNQLWTLPTDYYESLNITISLILPAQINQLRNDSNERRPLCMFAFVNVCEWKLLIKANTERCREEQSNHPKSHSMSLPVNSTPWFIIRDFGDYLILTN